MLDIVPVVAAISAALAGTLGYFLKGRIGGTEAGQLWQVAEKMRAEQVVEIRELRAENREHEKRIADCEKELGIAKALNETLERQNVWKDELIERLRSEVATLRAR